MSKKEPVKKQEKPQAQVALSKKQADTIRERVKKKRDARTLFNAIDLDVDDNKVYQRYLLTDVAVVPENYMGSDHRFFGEVFLFSRRREKAAKYTKRTRRTTIDWDIFASVASALEDTTIDDIDEDHDWLVQHGERELAREEEKNYVEFRKMEILYQFRPKTAATSKNADDSFPRRKRGVSMGFGERKAYFLSIRPNPKFATWFGKKRKSVAPTCEGDNKNKILLPVAPAPVSEKAMPREVEEEDETDDSKISSGQKGVNAKNPFIKGCPFWTVATGDEEEMAEDDYPVDIEAIERVVNGAELKRPPFTKKAYEALGEIDAMKKDDVLFDRELIFGNTVTTVLNLFSGDQKEGKEKSKRAHSPLHTDKSVKSEMGRVVTWANTITITTFEVEKREPKKKRTPQEEPMKDVKRMSTEKVE